MKNVKILFLSSVLVSFVACTGQTSSAENRVSTTGDSQRIEVYYFHFTARCTTCKTVEAGAKENLMALYPTYMNDGSITFQSINLDETSSKPLAERLGISGQTLLIVKGDQRINITNEGFMYAVVKPEKFKEIINEKVDGLLGR